MAVVTVEVMVVPSGDCVVVVERSVESSRRHGGRTDEDVRIWRWTGGGRCARKSVDRFGHEATIVIINLFAATTNITPAAIRTVSISESCSTYGNGTVQ